MKRTLAAIGWGFGALLLAGGCAGPAPITDCLERDGVHPICEFQNPEDLVDLGNRWLVVSQAPKKDSAGHLLAFRPADGERYALWPDSRSSADSQVEEALAAGPSHAPGHPHCPGPPDREAFAPHGMDLSRDRQTLLLVNHGGREAVEIFTMIRRNDRPALRWSGCVPMPDGAMMNDLASLPGEGFVVTQIASTGFGMLNILFGRVSGRVHEWTSESGLRPLPGTDGVGPNGVAVSADGQTLFIAEWGAKALVRIGRDGSGRTSVPLGFSPDNITWRSDGRLLVAGQYASPRQATGCFEVEPGTCGLGSAAISVDPATLAIERTWTHDPATVAGGISVALEHDGRIWLGTFGGDRLAWIEAP